MARFRDRRRAGASASDPDRRYALLAAALREWRGPVLGGQPDWLPDDPGVHAVEQARVECACALADVALQLRRAGPAASLVAEVAAAAPYDEPVHALTLAVTGGPPTRSAVAGVPLLAGVAVAVLLVYLDEIVDLARPPRIPGACLGPGREAR